MSLTNKQKAQVLLLKSGINSDFFNAVQELIKDDIFGKAGTSISQEFLKGMKYALNLPHELIERFEKEKDS